jgi:bacillithiol biosynthesis cysteine-adding enzyme BshC
LIPCQHEPIGDDDVCQQQKAENKGMEIIKTDYSTIGKWSHTDLAYIKQDQALDPYYTFTPKMSSIPKAIEQRKKYPVDRSLLLSVLKKQYEQMGASLPVPEAVILDENTYTVTTAHQPTLLTGPIYHIYKIASAINLSGQLNKQYPGQQFLPVFIVGGEDHDWDEINHLHLFGRRYAWEREASGSCGRLSLEGLEAFTDTITELFTNTAHGEQIKQLFSDSLAKAKNYGHFHQLLIQKLFGAFGLLVLHMDDPNLKRAFIPLMEKEIKEQFSFEHVTETQRSLAKAGFKPQAYCRDLNLFYMDDGIRERLDVDHGKFVRVESGITYTESELLSELQSHPDRFSPNVILRPLYQETILPNIAFIGGGGEIAYWLERKAQFEAAQTPFPMLVRRNSLLIIDEVTREGIHKTGLTWEAFITDYDSIVKSYISKHSKADIEVTVELNLLKAAYKSLEEKANLIDPTLAKAIEAEETKQLKQFEQLGSRLIRAEKQQQDTTLKRIRKLKEKLFPQDGLQERYENFLPYYSQRGHKWLETIIETSDPFESTFTILTL